MLKLLPSLLVFVSCFTCIKAQESYKAPQDYVPAVTIVTPKNNRIEIRVKNSRRGIPQSIDKIFQPFFTTKPTGDGTGLGLSLSYDIIKAHGGEINVNRTDQEGSEFIVSLPL